MAVIRFVDMVVIERVLEMSGGYVLRDFSNAKFRMFFAEHAVDIDDEQYKKNGDSKANRLRAFLQVASPPLVADVLEGLLELRQSQSPVAVSELASYRAAVAKLRSGVGAPTATTQPALAEDELMRRTFEPAQFAKLPVDPAVAKLLVERMEEAHRDIAAQAYLSAIFMCGSVLEGMCLGYGNTHKKEVNQAYAARYGQPPPKFREWKLAQWIEVLEDLGVYSVTIAKFGHALRDFRNYIHPGEQLAADFHADGHAARISFHVVVAAASDMARAEIRGVSDEEVPRGS